VLNYCSTFNLDLRHDRPSFIVSYVTIPSGRVPVPSGAPSASPQYIPMWCVDFSFQFKLTSDSLQTGPSTILEHTENFSSRPTWHAFSATRPVSMAPEALRRSGQFIGPPAAHSRSSTDPGGGQPPSPNRPSRRAGELIAFFEDKAAALSGEPSVVHTRAASAPGSPRPTTPATPRSWLASPTEAWARTSDRARSYTTSYGSVTDTRGYTMDPRTFTGTDTRTFTGTDTRKCDTHTTARTYGTDAQSDSRSFTSDTRGYTTDTFIHTRGFTSPESRSLTYTEVVRRRGTRTHLLPPLSRSWNPRHTPHAARPTHLCAQHRSSLERTDTEHQVFG
jgi:hypothetical protein